MSVSKNRDMLNYCDTLKDRRARRASIAEDYDLRLLCNLFAALESTSHSNRKHRSRAVTAQNLLAHSAQDRRLDEYWTATHRR
jgi:hypothetical protein